MRIQSNTEQAASGLRSPDSGDAAPVMEPALKEKWVEALRSGEYKQFRGGLCSDTSSKELCCLGVLWAVLDRPKGLNDIWDKHLLPSKKATLISMNDSEEKSFAEIADYIEHNL